MMKNSLLFRLIFWGRGVGKGRDTIHNERIDIFITRAGEGDRGGKFLVRGQTF